MSMYYYFCAEKQREYFELTSGSWYPYLEDLYDVLTACTKGKKSYKYFIKKLNDDKVFDNFYDDGEKFITDDNEKYFLRPLYDWAYDKDIRLIEDSEMYDLEVKLLCEKKNIKYEKNGWNYSDEIEKLLEKLRRSEENWQTNMKCVGKLNYDSKIMASIGVSFERAISELKAGATIWRHNACKFKLDKDKTGIDAIIDSKVLSKLHNPMFSIEDIFADNWTYEYPEEV